MGVETERKGETEIERLRQREKDTARKTKSGRDGERERQTGGQAGRHWGAIR